MDLYSAAKTAYNRLKTCRFIHEGGCCRKCGTPLETTYLEEQLYAVRCSHCDTVTLTKERNPRRAELHVGMIHPRIPLMWAAGKSTGDVFCQHCGEDLSGWFGDDCFVDPVDCEFYQCPKCGCPVTNEKEPVPYHTPYANEV